MNLINVEIGYPPTEKVKDDEWWLEFCALWPLADQDLNRETSHCAYSISVGPARITMEEASSLNALGVEVKIKPLPGAMMVKMQDRFKWEHGLNPLPEHLQSGAAVQIAIPDVGLLRVNEVTVREDCCTDSLQSDLDEGWRILAVCPPNAARRPDYVLGRTKTDDR